MLFRVNFSLCLAVGFRRLRRDCNGASAVEFALIAPLLLVGVFGILEVALIYFANQFLETATQTSARLIMTGQVKSATLSKEQFRQMVCERVKALLSCGNIYVDAQPYNSFAETEFNSPVSNRQFTDNTKFDTGNPGSIVVVRSFYKWPLFVAGLYGYDPSNIEGGYRLLSSSAAIRNEPFGGSP